MTTADHRTQVRDYLVSRRERITPAQAGLPAYGDANRRVKGLRREEVALLAGVSIDYYVRMERGTLAGASDAVRDGAARALQLDDAETRPPLRPRPCLGADTHPAASNQGIGCLGECAAGPRRVTDAPGELA